MICFRHSIPSSVKAVMALVLADARRAGGHLRGPCRSTSSWSQFLVLTEHFGDVADGEDVCDGGHDQAA